MTPCALIVGFALAIGDFAFEFFQNWFEARTNRLRAKDFAVDYSAYFASAQPTITMFEEDFAKCGNGIPICQDHPTPIREVRSRSMVRGSERDIPGHSPAAGRPRFPRKRPSR